MSISPVSLGDEQQAQTSDSPGSADESEPAKEESVKRELTAGEDPLILDSDEREKSTGFWRKEHTKFKPYGSVRLDFAGSDPDYELDDAGTRAGIAVELQFQRKFWLLGRYEMGVNFFDAIDKFLGRESEEPEGLSTRLAYVGLESDRNTLIFGKNWSSYYQVSGMTDRFASFGADASGTFNALSDGGGSGTGRADSVLQGRLSIDTFPDSWNLKPFKLHLQVQPGESISQVSGVEYDHSLGISAVLESKNETVLGIAYNQAFINEKDLPVLRPHGIDGDARALVVGTRRFTDDYYVATTVSLLKDHETTNDGVYFDGWGWEVFGSYNLNKKWWLIGGWNVLEPDSDQVQAGEFSLQYGVVGLRYTFDDFRRMIYSEIRMDGSRDTDGAPQDNIYTIGIRWDFP